MHVFVMRHAEAEFMAKSDETRPLTALGKQQALWQGKWLKERLITMDLHFDKIIVSPFFRAQQTFEQVNAVNDNKFVANLETWDGITPYGNGEVVADYLAFLKEEGAKSVLLISHLPLVSEIVAELYGKRNPVSFYPATIVHLDWNGNNATLETYKNAENNV